VALNLGFILRGDSAYLVHHAEVYIAVAVLAFFLFIGRTAPTERRSRVSWVSEKISLLGISVKRATRPLAL
jgi:hypothetical protein